MILRFRDLEPSIKLFTFKNNLCNKFYGISFYLRLNSLIFKYLKNGELKYYSLTGF